MSVPPDQPKDVMQQMMQAGQSMAKAYMDFLTKQQTPSASAGPSAMPAMPMPDLEPFAKMQQEFAAQPAQLWQSMLQRKPGEAAEPLVKPAPGDRRFSAMAMRRTCRCPPPAVKASPCTSPSRSSATTPRHETHPHPHRGR